MNRFQNATAKIGTMAHERRACHRRAAASRGQPMTAPSADPEIDLPLLLRSLVLPWWRGPSGARRPTPTSVVRHAGQASVLPAEGGLRTGLDDALPPDGGGALSGDEARGGAGGEARGHVLYGLQLSLNALWSLLFFGRRAPLAALVEILLLWTAIVLTIVAFARSRAWRRCCSCPICSGRRLPRCSTRPSGG